MGVVIIILTFLGMEGVAWFTHKFIMHGLLWNLHQDHHVKTDPHAVFEKNDSFFLIFAFPSIALFALWHFESIYWALYIAIGIAIYGFAYFMVHDIFIHQRIKIFTKSENLYLKAIRRGHKMHHKHLTKYNGESFGMLMVPFKYFRDLARRK